ncbi:MAG TPA: lmo0937 family membrane protein, partial [Gemmatimonadales bacterium]
EQRRTAGKEAHRRDGGSGRDWACPTAQCGQSTITLDGGTTMLWLAILLFIAWVLGFAVFHIAGGLIHLLLVLAVIVVIYRLITGRRVV